MPDFVQVRSVETYQFEDNSEEEEEVDLDQAPNEPVYDPNEPGADVEFPQFPPLVPPAGAGLPDTESAKSASTPEPAADTVFIEVPSGDMPGTTDGFGGLALGIAALAVGWLVARWL